MKCMDLLAALTSARTGKGVSQAALAARLGVPRLAVTRLEGGIGSIDLLVRAMNELELRLSGIARGHSLLDQLQSRRVRLGLSIKQAAQKAGLDHRTVAAVEHGQGTVASLLAVLAAIAPRAQRSEPPRASWAYDASSHGERDKRFTPAWFLSHVTAAFGPIDLDPCGHPESAVKARRTIILPQCGLASSWRGTKLAFVNPPFSAVSKWMARAADAWDRGEAETIVMLVPARTDSDVYQRRVSRDADTLFLGGRIRFGSAAGLAFPAPFSLMVVVWGAAEHATQRFIELVPSVRMTPWGSISSKS